MWKERSLLSILLLLSAAASAVSAVSAASDDAAAMSELAKSLTNAPSNWKPSTDPCSKPTWDGVSCQSGRVTSINLASKSISGELPDSISKLSSLQTLALQGNLLSGPLPSLSGLSSLQKIYLDGNAFSSIPPTFFSGLSSLQVVSLDDIPFASWSIPDGLADASTLNDFSASNASITGTIPEFLGNLSSLQNLRLSYNSLTGGIPPSFAGSSLQNLWLNNQQSADKLSGKIDPIGSMAQLSLLWLQSNSFTGPIPDVSKLSSLTSFNVRDNALTGVVPPSLTSSITLQNVSLSNNNFQGPYPAFSKSVTADVDKGNNFCNQTPGPCDPRVMVLLSVAAGFGYPLNLVSSWEGNDPCNSKWDGVTCDPQQKDVVILNLANRQLVGTISPDIANLTSLTKVLLNNNSLTGPIPDTMMGLKQLQLLDVSNNDLSGTIPTFGKNVNFKFSGNPLLGSKSSSGGATSGPPSPGGSETSGSSPPGGNQSAAGSKSSSAGFVVGIVLAVVVLVGCLSSLVYYMYRKKHSSKFGRVQTRSPPNEPEMVKVGMPEMSVNSAAVSELYSQGSGDTAATIPIEDLRRATNNFSQENILGRGGFGVVYKGDLNGTLIAVKRNESGMMGNKGTEEFNAEVHVLRKVRHRHLVAFLGYCKNENESLLVYEYMPEGTLGQHLFDRNESNYCALNWKQRLSIALDVARGIEYLHSFAQDSFIHRDLKPSNILLDKNLRAKVSDFGLVKLADKESMLTRLAGTFGYLAPEYAITGKVSTKVDVYAFGVVLMELITARKALDESEPDEQCRHLATAFRRFLIDKDKFTDFVDPVVHLDFLNLDQEAQESILKTAELACHCTVRDPNQRPNMSHAVNVLSGLVEKWNPSSASLQDDDDNLQYDNSKYDIKRRLELWQSDNDSFSTSTFATYKGSPSTRQL